MKSWLRPSIGSCRKFIFATGINLNSRKCSITDFILFQNDLPANAYCKWYSIIKYKILPQLFHYLFWYVDSRNKTAFCLVRGFTYQNSVLKQRFVITSGLFPYIHALICFQALRHVLHNLLLLIIF